MDMLVITRWYFGSTSFFFPKDGLKFITPGNWWTIHQPFVEFEDFASHVAWVFDHLDSLTF